MGTLKDASVIGEKHQLKEKFYEERLMKFRGMTGRKRNKKLLECMRKWSLGGVKGKIQYNET